MFNPFKRTTEPKSTKSAGQGKRAIGSFRLMIERVEDRDMMSADIAAAVLSNGILGDREINNDRVIAEVTGDNASAASQPVIQQIVSALLLRTVT